VLEHSIEHPSSNPKLLNGSNNSLNAKGKNKAILSKRSPLIVHVTNLNTMVQLTKKMPALTFKEKVQEKSKLERF
jgi:hypothetical protein